MPAGAPSLVHLLREAQRWFPERQAILHRGVSTSYASLWDAVLRFANGLRALGLRPGERVALLLENSAEYAAAYYGVLKAGGVAVGLNTAQRAPELARNLSHCGATFLVARSEHPELGGVVAACAGLEHVVVVGEAPAKAAAAIDWSTLLEGADAEDAGPDLDPGAAAAIIYTSGTTGDPRGVTLSHRNLVANTQSILAYLQLTESDRIVPTSCRSTIRNSRLSRPTR